MVTHIRILIASIIISLISGFVVTDRISAQNGEWEWLDPLPNGKRNNSFHVFNENKIIVSGDAGNVIITENAGGLWELIDSGTTSKLNSVFLLMITLAGSVARMEPY
ncbi:MAG: hypothetical protein ACFCU6_15110 [Balneolaceae bacterium]